MHTRDDYLLNQWMEQRNAGAFKEIACRYSGMVYGTCKRILANDADAEEVAQECFEILAVKGRKAGGYLGPWLQKVATNRALDRIKTDKRRRDREARFAADRKAMEEITWTDIYGHIDEAVASLPEKLRVPVVLHFYEHKTHEAIAQKIGVSRQTVTHRVRKGVGEMRRFLRRQGVVAPIAVLSSLLASHLTAEAAPLSLVTSLGKLALAGACGVTATASGPTSAAVATLGGMLLMKKVIVITSIVVIGAAGLWIAVQKHLGREADVVSVMHVDEPASPSQTSSTPVKPPPSAEELTVTTTNRGGALNGRVYNAETGRPIRAFRVGYMAGVVKMPGTLTLFENVDFLEVNDPAGSFSLSVDEPGTITVIGASSGFVPGTCVVIEESRMAAASEIELFLQPAAVVEGIVVTRARQPVENALVYMNAFDCPPPVDQAAARTDDGGSFHLDFVAPNTWMVGAYHPDYSPGWAYISPREAPVKKVTIVLSEGGCIEGTVTLAGVPLTGQQVEVEYFLDNYAILQSRAVTNSEGFYCLAHLPEGEPRVIVYPKTGGHNVDQLAVVEDCGVTVVDFHLAGDSGIEGTVFLDGEPLPDTHVSITVIGSDGSLQEFHTKTDSEGDYVFESIPNGQVVLGITLEAKDTWRSVKRTFEVPTHTQVEYDVAISSGAGGTLVCQVNVPEDFRVSYTAVLSGNVPLPRFGYETLHQIAAWKVAEPAIDDNSTFILPDLEPGTYTIVALAVDTEGGWETEGEMLANAVFNTKVIAVVKHQETAVVLSLRSE